MHLMGFFPQVRVSASYIKTAEKCRNFFFQTLFHLNTTSVDCKEIAARRACGWAREFGVAWACHPKLETCTCSAVNSWPRWTSTWAHDMVTWYWSADILFWQVSIQLTITWMSNIKDVRCKTGWSAGVWLPCWIIIIIIKILLIIWQRRRRRRRAVAPTSNDYHEKIDGFYRYGAPLGGPSGRRSSAINERFSFN